MDFTSSFEFLFETLIHRKRPETFFTWAELATNTDHLGPKSRSVATSVRWVTVSLTLGRSRPARRRVGDHRRRRARARRQPGRGDALLGALDTLVYEELNDGGASS